MSIKHVKSVTYMPILRNKNVSSTRKNDKHTHKHSKCIANLVKMTG